MGLALLVLFYAESMGWVSLPVGDGRSNLTEKEPVDSETGARIRIAELADSNSEIHDKTFENVEIAGPAILRIVQGNTFRPYPGEGDLAAMKAHTLVCTDEIRGAVKLYGCFFHNCTFRDITIQVQTAQAYTRYVKFADVSESATGSGEPWIESDEVEFRYNQMAIMNKEEPVPVLEAKFKRPHDGDYNVFFSQTEGDNRYQFSVIEKRRDGFAASIKNVGTFHVPEAELVKVSWQAVGS